MPKSLPPVAPNAAFFIDFDGTLVAIAERPDQVEVEPAVMALLRGLARRFNGAVAVVTGRPLETVDALLAPLVLPIAAEHGSVRRDAAGVVHGDTRGTETIERVAARLQPLVKSHPGLLLERKATSVALHYRQRPELAEICAAAIRGAAADGAALSVLPGKMVFEVRPAGVTKGTAVEAFLAEAPFRGRVPVYVGDDVTDEHAFAAVNAAGGISVKIGEGATIAQYRAEREGWLAWCAAQGEPGEGTA